VNEYQTVEASIELRRARWQAFCFRWRNLLAGAPLAIALLSTYVECERHVLVWSLAITLVAAGVALRAWATLYCAYGRRSGKTLATGGPYARVRNPLYLGNVLILAGATAASELLWLLPIGGAWALLVYGQVVRHEERRLSDKYGRAYRDYCASVPRWMPRLAASPARFRPSRTLEAVLVQSRALLLLVPFALKEWNLPGLW
jgi:protein-S-isoprenylcysteine O-methyltransferase Ste14